MAKGAVAATGVIAVALVSMLISGAAPLQLATSSTDRALLHQYWVGCHNQRLKTGGLTLDTGDLNDVPAGAEIWEKVIEKLRSNAMPPPGRPRPEASAVQAFVTH